MTTLNNDELREKVSEALTVYKSAPFNDAEPLKERRASEKQIDDIMQLIASYAEQIATAARIDAYADCGSKGGNDTEVRAYAKSRAYGLSELQAPKPQGENHE